MEVTIRVSEAFRIDISDFDASCALIGENRSVAEFPNHRMVWENSINHVRVFRCQAMEDNFSDDGVVGQDGVDDPLFPFGSFRFFCVM